MQTEQLSSPHKFYDSSSHDLQVKHFSSVIEVKAHQSFLLVCYMFDVYFHNYVENT